MMRCGVYQSDAYGLYSGASKTSKRSSAVNDRARSGRPTCHDAHGRPRTLASTTTVGLNSSMIERSLPAAATQLLRIALPESRQQIEMAHVVARPRQRCAKLPAPRRRAVRPCSALRPAPGRRRGSCRRSARSARPRHRRRSRNRPRAVRRRAAEPDPANPPPLEHGKAQQRQRPMATSAV